MAYLQSGSTEKLLDDLNNNYKNQTLTSLDIEGEIIPEVINKILWRINRIERIST